MKDAVADRASSCWPSARPRWRSTSGVALNFIMMALYATLLAQAWNMLGGYGGQFSFGHALFFGSGAYAQAIAQLHGRHQRLGGAGAGRRRCGGAGRRCSSAR